MIGFPAKITNIEYVDDMVAKITFEYDQLSDMSCSDYEELAEKYINAMSIINQIALEGTEMSVRLEEIETDEEEWKDFNELIEDLDLIRVDGKWAGWDKENEEYHIY